LEGKKSAKNQKKKTVREKEKIQKYAVWPKKKSPRYREEKRGEQKVQGKGGGKKGKEWRKATPPKTQIRAGKPQKGLIKQRGKGKNQLKVWGKRENSRVWGEGKGAGKGDIKKKKPGKPGSRVISKRGNTVLMEGRRGGDAIVPTKKGQTREGGSRLEKKKKTTGGRGKEGKAELCLRRKGF